MSADSDTISIKCEAVLSVEELASRVANNSKFINAFMEQVESDQLECGSLTISAIINFSLTAPIEALALDKFDQAFPGLRNGEVDVEEEEVLRWFHARLPLEAPLPAPVCNDGIVTENWSEDPLVCGLQLVRFWIRMRSGNDVRGQGQWERVYEWIRDDVYQQLWEGWR